MINLVKKVIRLQYQFIQNFSKNKEEKTMKNAKILLTLAAAVLFTVAMTATPLWATDYYVRTDGN
ncbi:hypothetical protein KJ656_15005, partial [bacterium]|nr:hypothetical protein [bacterium]